MSETAMDWLVTDKPWWRDALFLGFIGLAVATGGRALLKQRRFARAIETTEQCLALQDVACVGEAIAEARGVDADNPRVMVAEVDLNIVMGEGAAAGAALAGLEPAASAEARTRGDLLLAEGDYAAWTGQLAVAQERYIAAEKLVDATALVRPRLERLAHGADTLIDDLRAQFDKLFTLADEGRDDLIQLQVSDLTQRIARLQDADARQALQLAVAAAQRATSVRGARRRVDTAPPSWVDTPPVAPTPPPAGATSWMHDQFVQRQADYSRLLSAYNARQEAARRTRDQRAAESERTASDTVDKAHELFDTGIAKLRAALTAPAAGGGAP